MRPAELPTGAFQVEQGKQAAKVLLAAVEVHVQLSSECRPDHLGSDGREPEL